MPAPPNPTEVERLGVLVAEIQRDLMSALSKFSTLQTLVYDNSSLQKERTSGWDALLQIGIRTSAPFLDYIIRFGTLLLPIDRHMPTCPLPTWQKMLKDPS